MTREAKIGMLTGLGVIVLIGVLLSSYLGDGKGPGISPLAAASRMATLPAGESYRQQTLQPVGVPPMAPGGNRVKLSDGTEVLAPIDTIHAMVAAPIMVAEIQPSGPVVTTPVSPIPAPQALRDAQGGNPPTIEMMDPTRLFETKVKDPAAQPAAAQTFVVYTIAPGDNLAKIAKKFYNASKNSDVARIVRANPTMLKDATTPLIANKKLNIPGMVPAAAKPATDVSRTEGVVVYRPGDVASPNAVAVSVARKVERPAPAAATASPAKSGPEAAAAKVYVVQPGDTLEKIARRIAPSKVNETTQKIMALNGIKNAAVLQANAKLKLPS